MKKPQHTLYIIGGPARVGKTTIANVMMRRRPVILISTDTIRAGIKNLLIGELKGYPKKIGFKSTVAFLEQGSLKLRKKTFARSALSEDDLAWIGMQGIIQAYDRPDKSDLLIEGIAITPERIHALKLKSFIVKAAFIGYSDPSHVASILDYSQKKKDWVYKWIQERGGKTSDVNDWVKNGIVASAKMERSAKKFGYNYFDVTKRPFKKHVAAVLGYLLHS